MNILRTVLRLGNACLVSYLCAFLSIGILSPVASGQQQRQQRERLNIAVMDFDARGGLTREEAATLSDAFQAQLAGMGDFVLVDRARIRQILEEQGFQQSEACSQVECIVEAGKILNAPRGAASKREGDTRGAGPLTTHRLEHEECRFSSPVFSLLAL